MAKGTSFAEKAQRGAKKEKKFTVVKYVKSVVAEKSGAIRFQESMLKVPEDKNLDSYLKELEAGPIEEKIEEQVAAEAPSEAAEEAPSEDAPAAEEAPVEAAEEAPSEDAPAAEEAPVEAAEEAPAEDAEPKEKTES